MSGWKGWRSDPNILAARKAVLDADDAYYHEMPTDGHRQQELESAYMHALDTLINVAVSAAPLAQQAAGSTGGAPTREELAGLLYRAWISVNASIKPQGSESATWSVLADAILARWPAASRVPTGDKA
jgi:hypothetical protein